MENEISQLSSNWQKLNLPNTIAERAVACSFLCFLILKTKKKGSWHDIFNQVILAGVCGYRYLDLPQKPW